MIDKVLTTKEYLQAPYIRLVVPDEEDGFFAEILEFEGCFADGKTPAQALRNLEKVAADWLDAKLEDNAFIPPPAGNADMSGRFALRLPHSLHYKIALYAEREGVSLNTFIVNALAGSVGMLDLIDRYVSRIS